MNKISNLLTKNHQLDYKRSHKQKDFNKIHRSNLHHKFFRMSNK